MAGGQREVTLELSLGAGCFGEEVDEEWNTTATFYESETQVDAVLGCPWLGERRLGIFPS